MAKPETLPEFYQHHFQERPATRPPEMGQVNVFRLEDVLAPSAAPVPYSRRDFYKITLIRGRNAYHYADKSLETAGPTLLFFNPQVPYTWQPLSADATGFFCIFREEFFLGQGSPPLTGLPLFQPGHTCAYPLTAAQDAAVSALYEKILAELYPSRSGLRIENMKVEG